jgi:hypothetical protein
VRLAGQARRVDDQRASREKDVLHDFFDYPNGPWGLPLGKPVPAREHPIPRIV